MTYKVTVYQSGNSKVITIPAKLDVEVGDQFTLTKTDTRLIMEKVEKKLQQTQIKKDLKIIDKFAGRLKGWPKHLDTIEKLEAELEGIYD
jgi:virulence-associated protein VagC